MDSFHNYLRENLSNKVIKMEEDQIKKKARISISHYTMMDTLSKINNAEFFLFLQPSALSWDNFLNSEFYKSYLDYEKKNQPIYINNLKNFYDELRKNNKLIDNFYDFREVLNSTKEEIYKDHIHYDDIGTNIISDEVLKILSSSYNWN